MKKISKSDPWRVDRKKEMTLELSKAKQYKVLPLFSFLPIKFGVGTCG
jgi:hypothetical protein